MFSRHDHINLLDRLTPADLSVTLGTVVDRVLGVVHNQGDVKAEDQAELRGQKLQKELNRYGRRRTFKSSRHYKIRRIDIRSNRKGSMSKSKILIRVRNRIRVGIKIRNKISIKSRMRIRVRGRRRSRSRS